MPNEPEVCTERRERRQHHAESARQWMNEISDPERNSPEEKQKRHSGNEDEVLMGHRNGQATPRNRGQHRLLQRVGVVPKVDIEAVNASIAAAIQPRRL